MTRVALAAVVVAATLVVGGAAPPAAAVPGPNLVISQVYGGGGAANGTFNNDFVELFNRGDTAQSLAGWSIQYGSSTGSTWQVEPLSTTASVAPGQYFLLQVGNAASNGGGPLPTPDQMGTVISAMGVNAGKVVLADSTTTLADACPVSASIRDMVGYGTANCAEGTPTAGLISTTAAMRLTNGCTDTNVNSSDFAVQLPRPRTSGMTPFPCGPDLVVTSVGDPPATREQGEAFSIGDNTMNEGAETASASSTSYFLSSDGTSNTLALSPARSVPSLGPQVSSFDDAMVTVPHATPVGNYFVRACADSTAAVVESDELNNCRASVGQIAITAPAPDLVITDSTGFAGSVPQGGQIEVHDETTNTGSASAGSSTTTHYLATAAGATTGIVLHSRIVPALMPGGASEMAPTDATVPVDTPPGDYLIVICADTTSAVPESDEDNCIDLVGTVTVTGIPNLEVTAVAEPPATRMQGQVLTVSDTTNNDSPTSAAASKTRSYLSPDAVWDDTDIAHVTRDVPMLAGGSSSVGNPVGAAIPLSTPVGSYHVIACADDDGAITESNEGDNCTASTGKVSVTKALPDLITSAVSRPPASRKQGASFSVTDTAKNKGLVKAGASETWYHLSADKALGAGDKRLLGARNVPGLPAGAASQGTKNVSIPATTRPGTYFVLACSDGGKLRPETKENNNCRASGDTIKVVKK